MSYLSPDNSLLLRERYKIYPLAGIWVFESLEVPNSCIVFSSCTVPSRYYPPHTAEWNGIQINLSLCDWTTSFGISTPPYPTLSEFVALLYAARIPGPCSESGGGTTMNIYTDDGTLAGNRVLTGNLNNLTFSGLGTFQTDSTGLISNFTTETNTGTSTTNNVSNVIYNGTDFTVNGTNATINSDTTDIASTFVLLSQPPPSLAISGTTQVLLRDPGSSHVSQATATSLAAYTSASNPTIYTSDSSLSSNRIINQSALSLTFQNGSSFNVTGATLISLGSADIRTPNSLPVSTVLSDIVVREAGTGKLYTRNVSTLPASPSIYTANGTLTSDRTATLSSYNLTFSGGNTLLFTPTIFNVNSSSTATLQGAVSATVTAPNVYLTSSTTQINSSTAVTLQGSAYTDTYPYQTGFYRLICSTGSGAIVKRAFSRVGFTQYLNAGIVLSAPFDITLMDSTTGGGHSSYGTYGWTDPYMPISSLGTFTLYADGYYYVSAAINYASQSASAADPDTLTLSFLQGATVVLRSRLQVIQNDEQTIVIPRTTLHLAGGLNCSFQLTSTKLTGTRTVASGFNSYLCVHAQD